MTLEGVSFGCPFSLPLERDPFGNALRKGHGRALMHVRRHGAAGLEDLVVDACVHDKTFDPQCEGDRAPWMLEIIDASGLEAIVCEKVPSALSAEPGTQSLWDADHMCRLAVALARRGHGNARSAIYSAFRKSADSADLIGAEEIIELDGADGLLFVSEQIGVWLAEDPEIKVSDYPLLCYDERHGTGSAERLLRSAKDQSNRIAVYLAHIRGKLDGTSDTADQGREDTYFKPDMVRFGVHGKSRWDRIGTMSPDDVVRDIEAGAPGMGKYAYSGWGKHASQDALQEIANRMFRESDPGRLARFLGVFQHRPLPDFDARLLDFVGHPDRDVHWVTTFVLANHRHPEVRALAIDCVRAGRHNKRELLLFRNNYQPGDWTVIREGLRWPSDKNEVHWTLSDLLEVFEANEVEEALEPLTLIYEHSPCTNCRRRALKSLHRMGRAPDWLLEECCFDADDGIRDIVT
jgi:hypothetical protein